MIKKTLDDVKATKEQKKDIYKRICADYEEKAEKRAKYNWVRYSATAAATVLVVGGVAVGASVIISKQGVPISHSASTSGTQNSISIPENSVSAPENSSGEHICNEDGVCDCASEDIQSATKIDTKPIILTWYNFDENTPQMQQFKATYGTPATKPAGYEDTPDDNAFCNIVSTSFANKYVELAKLISSDQSPDIFPYHEDVFPVYVNKGLFSSVDDLFDLNSDEWELQNKYGDALKWQGETYVPIISIDASDYIWYRKSIIEEYGLPDPYTLYKEGKWDMDTFFDMSEQFTKNGEGIYAIDGYSQIIDAFIGASGKAFFSIENDKLTNNLYDSDIETLVDKLVTKINDKENPLRDPVNSENNWIGSKQEWVKGNLLFWAMDGYWIYEDLWQKYKADKGWSDDEIQFVPFPKSDNNDNYYRAHINSYMLCKGSKNENGYAAWVYANLLCEQNPDIHSAIRKEKIDKFGWTDELLDRLKETTDTNNATPVFDVIYGVGSDYNSETSNEQNALRTMRDKIFAGKASFAEARGECESAIQSVVNKLNG